MTEQKKKLPQGETPDEARERIAPEVVDPADPGPGATIRERIAALVEELRGPDGRGANCDISLAITHLEDASLRLGAAGIK